MQSFSRSVVQVRFPALTSLGRNATLRGTDNMCLLFHPNCRSAALVGLLHQLALQVRLWHWCPTHMLLSCFWLCVISLLIYLHLLLIGPRVAARRPVVNNRRNVHVARSQPSQQQPFQPYQPVMDWDRLSAEDIESWDNDNGPPTPLLDSVNFPVHLKNFNTAQLRQLCKELRSDVVHTVSQTGGHLSSSLGVVELTVALHYVFNAPEDKVIFDVGHQCYIHKILTGRRKGMRTIRQTNGLSGALHVVGGQPAAFGLHSYKMWQWDVR